ncbi:ethanolamine kinase [Culicoides brevitarsis]|uniref:ethanolamine kinase n=1 Tax=Culicoides brevitarsis TaxID=469753 RepID=UPI00307B4115
MASTLNSPPIPQECFTKNGISHERDSAVAKVNLTIDENHVIEGARDVLKVIRPQWNSNDIKFKLFTDGITNKLVGCFHDAEHHNGSNSSPEAFVKANKFNNNKISDVVLIRIYGNKTDLLIDRKAETRNIKLLHRYGFAPRLYATFCNGLAYEYVPGRTLNVDTVTNPEIWPLVARQMARMHKINLEETGSDKEPMLFGKMQQFFKLVPKKFTDPKKQEKFNELFPSLETLYSDFNSLYKHLKQTESPIVFCHNDLLLGNVIYTEEEQKVTFIDYEYAACNFQGFDIGNHFTEYGGIDEIDYARYPSKEYQWSWLREYLKEYLAPKAVTEQDIKQLYITVNKFALASHYFWTIWALIQAEHSTIDFDFMIFGYTRYAEYLAKKDAFLGLSS